MTRLLWKCNQINIWAYLKWEDQVERGEYKIEEGWDGIKAGFLQRPGAGQVIAIYLSSKLNIFRED